MALSGCDLVTDLGSWLPEVDAVAYWEQDSKHCPQQHAAQGWSSGAKTLGSTAVAVRIVITDSIRFVVTEYVAWLANQSS